MYRRRVCFALLLIFALTVFPATARAETLWVGSDIGSGLGSLNVTGSGVVLGSLGIDAIGFAINGNNLFVNDGTDITKWDTSGGSPSPVATFGFVGLGRMDMTMASGRIWAADPFQFGLVAIDPDTGSDILDGGFISLGFEPSGVASDGASFWVSQLNYDPSAQSFDIFKVTGGVLDALPALSTPFIPVGLAYGEGSLWVGDTVGGVHRFDPTSGAEISSFSLGDGRIVGGLEAPTPEPASMLLIGSALVGIGFMYRRRRRA